jgi:hypothetical protein
MGALRRLTAWLRARAAPSVPLPHAPEGSAWVDTGALLGVAVDDRVSDVVLRTLLCALGCSDDASRVTESADVMAQHMGYEAHEVREALAELIMMGYLAEDEHGLRVTTEVRLPRAMTPDDVA